MPITRENDPDVVDDDQLTTAPVSPLVGETHITKGQGGAWSGIPIGSIVVYIDSVWQSYPPEEGHEYWVSSRNLVVRYNGSAWEDEQGARSAYSSRSGEI